MLVEIWQPHSAESAVLYEPADEHYPQATYELSAEDWRYMRRFLLDETASVAAGARQQRYGVKEGRFAEFRALVDGREPLDAG